MDQIDEIKKRIDIVDLLSSYLTLKKAGRNFKALCPFHSEKTPSFMVSPEKQIYYCFGCNRGGDIFKFVQEIERVDFSASLKILADKAGVILRNYEPKVKQEKDRYFNLNELATKFYQKILFSPKGKDALDYLMNKRNLSKETIEEFRLGFAPADRDLFVRFLKSKNQILRDAQTVGLIIQGRYGPIDRFSSRIIFPILNPSAKIIGFSARLFGEGKEQAKYINSPTSLIYDKSETLYGLNLAKEAIRKSNQVILVEGNLDVISSHQAGVKNVVCSSGTALTREQLGILKRFAENLVLAFDQDEAGRLATLRVIDLALDDTLFLKIAQYEGAKDPDELIKKNPLFWRQAIERAISVFEFCFEKSKEGFSKPYSGEAKKMIAKKFLPIVKKIPNPVEQAHWVKTLALELDVSEAVIHQSLSRFEDKPLVLPEKKIFGRSLGEEILGLFFSFPKIGQKHFKRIKPSFFETQELGEIYKKLELYYNRKDNFDYQEFRASLDQGLVERSDYLAMLCEGLEEKEAAKAFDEVLLRAESNKRGEKKRIIEEEIKKAEERGDLEAAKKLLRELQNLY